MGPSRARVRSYSVLTQLTDERGRVVTMADRKGDETKRPEDCGRRNGQWKSCRHLRETSGNDMDGETYHCDVCGEHYRLHYEDMA